MKFKLIITFLAISFSCIVKAQNLNVSYTDCNGNTESLYNVLGSGQVVLIASKGLDCSICMSQAPSNESFAASNMGRIKVWGAMAKRYTNTPPSCMELNTWKNSYNWNSIFMFVDANKNFEGQGYPTYYVISPADSSIYYKGNSFTTASQRAVSLADSLGLVSTSINNVSTDNQTINYTNNTLFIKSQQLQENLLVFDINGKIVMERNLLFNNNTQESITLPALQKGIYIVKTNTQTKRIAIQ